MNISREERYAAMLVVRLVIYIAILIATAVMMWKLADVAGSDTMREDGIVENLQLVVLCAASALYGIGAWRLPEWRPLLCMLSALALAAAVRECDYVFDELIPVVSWKFCWLFVLGAMLYMWKYGKQVRRLLPVYICSSAFFMCIAAVVVLVPAAQCVGHRSFIVAAAGIEDTEMSHLVRRALEEPLELVGYIVILLSAVEFYFTLARKSVVSRG